MKPTELLGRKWGNIWKKN